MNETIDPAQKDSQIFEREIDQTRAALDRTLSALGKKLSPSDLLDKATSYFCVHGGEMAKAVGRFAKDNPVPVALMGVGVAWILLTPKSANDLERDGYVSGRDEQEDATEEYAGNRSTSKAGDEPTESELSTLGAAKERISSVAQRAVNRAQSQTEALTSRLRVMAQEQPLLLAALGITLGAAIGAVLPESEPEHRWLGPARDRTWSKIKEEGEHAYEQVRGATQRAVEDVKQAVWEVTTGSKN